MTAFSISHSSKIPDKYISQIGQQGSPLFGITFAQIRLALLEWGQNDETVFVVGEAAALLG